MLPSTLCIHELMDAVDSYIPTPDRKSDLPFLMPVEDVFTITGRGTVATGRVERGMAKVGEEVEIIGLTGKRKKSVITGLEMFRKTLDFAEAGDNVGVLLRGVQRNEIERGQVLCKPGTIHPHTKFRGQVYVLTKEEGGRHTRSSTTIVLSSISERPTLPVLSLCPRAPRCACLAITSRWMLS